MVDAGGRKAAGYALPEPRDMQVRLSMQEGSVRKIAVMACLLVLLAACAGGKKEPDKGPAPLPAGFDAVAATPEQVAALPRNQASAAVDAMVDAFVAETNKQCAAEIVGQDCLNRRYAAAFDPDGQFGEFCAMHGNGLEYRLCLMVAAETAPLVIAAGGNPGSDIAWSNLDDMNNAGRKKLMGAILPECGEEKSCIIGEMAQRLGFSRFVRESCQEHARFLDQLNCITDSISVTVYRRAIAATS